MKDVLHLDYETRSAVDLTVTGAHVYAKHPTTDIWVAGYAFNDEEVQTWFPGEPLPRELKNHIISGKEVHGHNVSFEILITNHTAQKHGWPPIQPNQTVCTMAMCYSMQLPGKLENAAPALGMIEVKDLEGSRVMKQLAKPREIKPNGEIVWWDDPEKIKKLVLYCKQDVVVERELGKRLMRLSEEEFELWKIDQRINDRGVMVDIKSAKKALSIVEMEKKSLDEKMRLVTNNAVATCTATGQLTDWLRWRGIDVKGVAKGDVLDLLKTNLPEDCKTALKLRQEAAKSSTAKLESMIEAVDSDGRIKGMFQYHGAGATGRWAGRKVNLQNLPRPNLDQETIDKVFGVLSDVE